MYALGSHAVVIGRADRASENDWKPWGIRRIDTQLTAYCVDGATDGTRTHNNQNHNLGLYH